MRLQTVELNSVGSDCITEVRPTPIQSRFLAHSGPQGSISVQCADLRFFSQLLAENDENSRVNMIPSKIASCSLHLLRLVNAFASARGTIIISVQILIFFRFRSIRSTGRGRIVDEILVTRNQYSTDTPNPFIVCLHFYTLVDLNIT